VPVSDYTTERQKATRNVKRLTKRLSTLDDESEKSELMRKIHSADVDVNYAIYYPLLKPYVSLFPSPKKDKGASAKSLDETTNTGNNVIGATDGPKGNIEIWNAVEKAMEDGTLEALRNSRDGISMRASNDPAGTSHKGKKAKQHFSSQATSENAPKDTVQDESDSDGGFFDEDN
jgi:hypothetical protein